MYTDGNSLPRYMQQYGTMAFGNDEKERRQEKVKDIRMVCVDDEKPVLEIVKDACCRLPWHPEVHVFNRALPALDFIKKNPVDIALLDIHMPDLNGLSLAARIKEQSPDTAVIFLTGYAGYAVEAFALHVSGYLMKPLDEQQLAAEVEYALSQRKAVQPKHHIMVRTFGEFDLTVDGKVVSFSRAKAKELFAYLIDRHGGYVTRAFLYAALFEEKVYDRPAQKYLDVIIRSLRQTLQKAGIGEILEMSGGSLRICPEKLECDLYQFLDGNIDAIKAYRGEYMNAYSWASLTEALADRVMWKG